MREGDGNRRFPRGGRRKGDGQRSEVDRFPERLKKKEWGKEGGKEENGVQLKCPPETSGNALYPCAQVLDSESRSVAPSQHTEHTSTSKLFVASRLLPRSRWTYPTIFFHEKHGTSLRSLVDFDIL